jgi:tetratricopeptide (TPR) repeat protein
MPNAVDLTRQGIAAYNAGDLLTARDCFARANETDPAYEMAWLWRSSVVGSDAEKRAYLEKALAINPASAAARRGLAQLGDVIAAPSERAEPSATAIVAPEAPEESATKQCAFCAKTIQAAAIVCLYCGRDLVKMPEAAHQNAIGPTAPARRGNRLAGIALALALLGLLYWTMGVYTIQPLGALPAGLTVIVWRGAGEPFFNSPDAVCLKVNRGVSLLCRGIALGAGPVDRIIVHLPYQQWAYMLSTGGRTFEN